MKEIELPFDFNAFDSDLEEYRISIPKGFKAEINKDNVILKKVKNEDEKIKRKLIKLIKISSEVGGFALHKWEADEMLAWLEKQSNKPKQASIWKHWKDGIAGNGESEPIYLVKNGNAYSLNSCLCFECDYIELSELDNLMLNNNN